MSIRYGVGLRGMHLIQWLYLLNIKGGRGKDLFSLKLLLCFVTMGEMLSLKHMNVWRFFNQGAKAIKLGLTTKSLLYYKNRKKIYSFLKQTNWSIFRSKKGHNKIAKSLFFKFFSQFFFFFFCLDNIMTKKRRMF